MKTKSLLMGMLAGGVAAGIATLLAAPKSGYETRRTLIANKNEFMGSIKDIKEAAVELKDTVSTASKEGKDVIQSFVTDVKTAIFEWKMQTEANKIELQKDVMELEESIKELESELASSNAKE
ncbi:YtxH domain-containing protein [Mesobacillus subterraneus]|uniref:YtxH domain-containing protein n=1 Tax=Mesobacillus subterraneus TaxID=285983 RepID=A0A427TYL3_9BACI|nr:YtxH domain-containing protein [Mesobacillus subterraneus]RSD29280.1 YtxH domain-containing protein [Mesobacillus subterraneus]